MNPEAEFTPSVPEQALVKAMPTIERVPDLKVEAGIESGAEHHEQRADLTAAANDASITTSTPTPVATTNVVDDTSYTVSPVVAADDDLIEKEWVDRAKKIIAETQNDPYQRGQEVSKLQSDYIKKRYGRELGISE